MISTRAPQYRQYALMSDFLDLANLNIREEAALATNWIKDRPEGLKLHNLALATIQAWRSAIFRKIGVQMFSMPLTNASLLAQGNKLSFTGIHRQWQRIFSCMWQSFDLNSCRICTSSAVCCFRAPLGGNFDIFAASSESTAWMLLWTTHSRSTGVRVCPAAQFNFFDTAFDGQWL